MRAEQLTYRLTAALSLLAVSGALFYRAVIFYRAPWAILGGLSAVFLALSIPWLLSALCGWNTWELHFGAVVAGFIFIPLGVILFAWLGADLHHATDFAQNAVARGATVRTVTHTEAYAGDGSEIWSTNVSLALAQPVAGRHLASLQLPGQQVYYPTGQQLKVLIDPKAPGDAELASAPGVPTALLVSLPIWGTASAAFGVFCIVSLCWRVLPGGTDDRQRPDFLNATWRSWAAWLPFFALTGVSVYAVTHWPQWWLFLLPGIAMSMLGPVLPALRRYLDVLP
jgi:hypothetical protein